MVGQHIKNAIAPALFLCALGYIVYLLASCKPAEGPTLPKYCTEEALYTARLLRCVDAASTLAESQACRQQVDYECGIRQTTRTK